MSESQQDQPLEQPSLQQDQQQASPASVVGIAKSLFASTFGFKKTPLSILFVLTYIFITLIATQVQTAPPSVLDVYPEKYLLSSWTDLQQISKEFHPYSSHANDRVHDYIFKQVCSIVSHASSDVYISAHDDVRSILFEEPDVFDPRLQGRVVYYEGNNVLVKIQGNDTSLGAILVSAHYDSVPTAYGTTDDGTGIASMLGILRYYADSPAPHRSIIFNFNNNEEFGLLGAQAFFGHPWSKEVKYFINLEGTGAGGRAILFRSSDYGVTKHYKAASSPHLNSIFQQGFTSGYIRSETDYKVYTSKGLRGLDVAFYKPRNLYHTRRDSIRGTTYGALSHMFTNALDVVRSMSLTEKGGFSATQDDKAPAVYFDILGIYSVVLPLGFVFQAQVVGIIAGPLILIGLFLTVLKTNSWPIGIRGWSRGIVSLVVSGSLTILTSKWVQKQNELVVMSQFFSPLLLLLSIFLLSNYLLLALAAYVYPVPDQKLIILIELFVILWAALVASTIDISQSSATGEYIIPVLYYLYLVAVILGLLSLLFTTTDDLTLSKDELAQNAHSHYTDEEEGLQADEQTQPLLQNEDSRSYGAHESDDNEYPSGSDGESYNSEDREDNAAEETTAQDRPRSTRSPRKIGPHGEHTLQDHLTTREKIRHLASRSLSFDWSLQFLVIVPIGLYLVYASGLLTFEALRENAQEGSARASGVYFELIVVAIVLGSLVVPFVHRLHGLLPVVLLGIVVVCGYRSLSLPALSHTSPLKLRFLQSIDLDDENSSATVSILSRQGYGYNVIADFPSVKEHALPITCRPFNNDGNEVCSYEGPRPYVINGDTPEEAGDYNRWLNVTVLQTHNNKSSKLLPPFGSFDTQDSTLDDDSDFGPFTGEIFIEAKDSRVCTVTFNTTIYKSGDIYGASPVRTVTVYHDSVGDVLDPPGNASLVRHKGFGTSQFPESINKLDPVRDPETLKYYKGINDVTVHKLNWTQKGYHLSFLWIPRWYENAVSNLAEGQERYEMEVLNQQNQETFVSLGHKYSNKHQYGALRTDRQNKKIRIQEQEDEQRIIGSVNDGNIQKSKGADKRALGVEVKCYWGEYDAESLIGYRKKKTDERDYTQNGDDMEPVLVRKVPALDEALLYGPKWTSWTNWASGVVEVKKYVEL